MHGWDHVVQGLVRVALVLMDSCKLDGYHHDYNFIFMITEILYFLTRLRIKCARWACT